MDTSSHDDVHGTRPMPLQVMALAWPVMAHMLLTTLVFVASRAWMGRLGSTALGSMQMSGPLLWSMQSVFTAFSAGTLAVVGRSQGAGDRAMASTVARVSLLLALGLGVVVTVPLWLGLPEFLAAVFPSAGEETRAASVTFMRAALVTQPLQFMEAVAAAVLQGSGNTRTPLRVGVLVNVLNVVLAPWLMFGGMGVPALGVMGAGMAAGAALGLEGLLLGAVLLGRGSPVDLRLRVPGQAREALRRMAAVCTPTIAEKVIFHAGFTAYAAMIARLGPSVMAANQALIAVESLCFLSAEGMGVAAGALVSRRLGAGLPRAASRAGWWAAGMAAGFLWVVGVVCAVGAPWLLPWVTPETDIAAQGISVARIMPLLEPLMAVGMVLAMALRGAGATRSVLVLTLVCAVGVRLLATHVLTQVIPLGLWGVWLGATADWACRALVASALFARGRWQSLRV